MKDPAIKSVTSDIKSLPDLADVWEELKDPNKSYRDELWRLADHLLEEVPHYSLHPELYSYTFNVTVVMDLVSKQDLTTYNLIPKGFGQDKKEANYEYMIKALYYDLLARKLGAAYQPHPARVPIVGFWSLRNFGFKELSQQVFVKIDDFVKDTISPLQSRFFRLPPLLTYVLNQCNHAEDIIPTALEIRSLPGCKHFRSQMNEMTVDLQKSEGGIKVAKYFGDLDELIRNLRKELGLEKQEVQPTVWIVETPLKLPAWSQNLSILGTDIISTG